MYNMCESLKQLDGPNDHGHKRLSQGSDVTLDTNLETENDTFYCKRYSYPRPRSYKLVNQTESFLLWPC
jgi:hypothetical protein